MKFDITWQGKKKSYISACWSFNHILCCLHSVHLTRIFFDCVLTLGTTDLTLQQTLIHFSMLPSYLHILWFTLIKLCPIYPYIKHVPSLSLLTTHTPLYMITAAPSLISVNLLLPLYNAVFKIMTLCKWGKGNEGFAQLRKLNNSARLETLSCRVVRVLLYLTLIILNNSFILVVLLNQNKHTLHLNPVNSIRSTDVHCHLNFHSSKAGMSCKHLVFIIQGQPRQIHEFPCNTQSKYSL